MNFEDFIGKDIKLDPVILQDKTNIEDILNYYMGKTLLSGRIHHWKPQSWTRWTPGNRRARRVGWRGGVTGIGVSGYPGILIAPLPLPSDTPLPPIPWPLRYPDTLIPRDPSDPATSLKNLTLFRYNPETENQYPSPLHCAAARIKISKLVNRYPFTSFTASPASLLGKNRYPFTSFTAAGQELHRSVPSPASLLQGQESVNQLHCCRGKSVTLYQYCVFPNIDTPM